MTPSAQLSMMFFTLWQISVDGIVVQCSFYTSNDLSKFRHAEIDAVVNEDYYGPNNNNHLVHACQVIAIKYAC